MTAWPTPDLVQMSLSSGIRYFTLAFVVADTKGAPSWGGVVPLSQLAVDQIAAIRARGGDVIVSLGGANGQELAQVITDPSALATAYASVVSVTGCKRLDFDIEGGAVADPPSVTRRNQALALLQKSDPSIIISYCLPVMQTGFTGDGMNILKGAAKAGVILERVAGMQMDYGGNVADMGAASIASTRAMKTQLSTIAAYASTPVSPIVMLGENDVPNEVFDLAAAAKLLAFASSTSYIKSLHFWSMARDTQGQLGVAADDGSGIVQQPWAFSKLLGGFH